jgi:hypothetical protein
VRDALRRLAGLVLPFLAVLFLVLVWINARYVLPDESLSIAALKIARRFDSLAPTALLLAACLLAVVAWRPMGHARVAVAGALWVVFGISVLMRGKMEGLGLDSLREVQAANLAEAWGYVKGALLVSGFETREVQALAAFAAAGALLAWLLRSFTSGDVTSVVILVLTVGAALAGVPSSLLGGAVAADLGHYRAQMQRTPAAQAAVTAQASDLNVLVMIGESTPRGSFMAQPLPMHAAGSTTVIYRDVISPHSHTFPVLYRALGVAIDPDGDRFRSEEEIARASVVDVLRSYGVRVEWWTNQAPRGTRDWLGELFGQASDRLSGNSQLLPAEDPRVRLPDHQLIEKVLSGSGVFSGSPTVAFVSTYAGHWDYCDHIDPAFARRAQLPWDPGLSAAAVFGDLPLVSVQRHLRNIACHHAAAAYVRANVARLIAAADASPQPLAVVYFSDHGEDPYDGSAHDSSRNSFRHLQVPLVLHFNAEAARRHPRVVANAQAQAGRGHSTDVFADTLLDLRGLKPAHRASMSLVGPVTPQPSRYSLLRDTISGQRTVVAIDREDRPRPAGIALAGHDHFSKQRLLGGLPASLATRVCAHRADSLMKIRDAAEIFPCIEIDLLIDPVQRQVFVNHPPKPNHGLSLEAALAHPGVPERTLWLDVKNLEVGTAAVFEEVLVRAIPAASRKQVMVETGATDARLLPYFKRLADAGFSLSYYLPPEPANTCSSRTDTQECRAYRDKLVGLFEVLPFSHLSFEKAAFPFASSLPLPRAVKLATWDLSVNDLKQLDQDVLNRVALYIIPYQTRFDY